MIEYTKSEKGYYYKIIKKKEYLKKYMINIFRKEV